MSDPPLEPSPTVKVTPAARSFLAGRLERHGAPEGGVCFRLRLGPSRRMSTTVTEPADDDVLVHHRDKAVLAIESGLAAKLRGNTIDVEKTDGGRAALIVL
jgi:hypothetical protein